jgi:hypothetical protein
VEAHDQVSSVRDEQSTGAVETLGLNGVEFLKHGRRVDDETGSDEGDTLGVDQAGRQGVESVLHPLAGFLVVDNDGVAGVVSTSASRADIGFGGENVRELALSFVTPLGSEAMVEEMSKGRGKTGDATYITVTPAGDARRRHPNQSFLLHSTRILDILEVITVMRKCLLYGLKA